MLGPLALDVDTGDNGVREGIVYFVAIGECIYR